MSATLDLHRLYRVALRIRLVESRIAELYSEGNIRCPVHLSVGQEIPSAIFEQIKRPGDTAISTHRAHAHYLSMGGNLSRMIAEIYGKVTGCSKGRGGSMHLIDLEVGFLGSSAIVGNSIPVGVGAAYANQLRSDGTITFVFLGDGATEEGAFYESANFAAIHKLPVVFVLENNLYSVYTGLNPRQPSGRSISNLAEAIGLKSLKTEDSSFDESFSKFKELDDYSRSGAGPTLLEISTYRKLEHCGPNDDDSLNYRPKSEIKRYKDTDLIKVLEQCLSVTANESDIIKAEIESEINAAFEFAENSPFPTYSEATRGVYAN